MMMMEPGDALFRLFHRYNKLVRRGLVRPLVCKSCATPYITAVDGDDELILRCLACPSDVTPGIDTIGKVRAVVTEHFLDEY
jgi:hypothetical protein